MRDKKNYIIIGVFLTIALLLMASFSVAVEPTELNQKSEDNIVKEKDSASTLSSNEDIKVDSTDNNIDSSLISINKKEYEELLKNSNEIMEFEKLISSDLSNDVLSISSIDTSSPYGSYQDGYDDGYQAGYQAALNDALSALSGLSSTNNIPNSESNIQTENSNDHDNYYQPNDYQPESSGSDYDDTESAVENNNENPSTSNNENDVDCSLPGMKVKLYKKGLIFWKSMSNGDSIKVGKELKIRVIPTDSLFGFLGVDGADIIFYNDNNPGGVNVGKTQGIMGCLYVTIGPEWIGTLQIQAAGGSHADSVAMSIIVEP